METWYVLEDGTAVHPSDVSPGKDGRLRHKGGAMVAMRGDVPSSRSADPDAERAKARSTEKQSPAKADRQMHAGRRGRYETR